MKEFKFLVQGVKNLHDFRIIMENVSDFIKKTTGHHFPPDIEVLEYEDISSMFLYECSSTKIRMSSIDAATFHRLFYKSGVPVFEGVQSLPKIVKYMEDQINEFKKPIPEAVEKLKSDLKSRISTMMILEVLKKEIESAREKHPQKYVDWNHAYGVLAEEVQEFFDEMRIKNPDTKKVVAELLQVAAVAIRAIEDLAVEEVKSNP